MNVHPNPTLFDADEFLAQQERKSQLRFIVCGSVDHGKSTLIGRLLFEAGLLFADQLDALDHDSRRHGTRGDELDFALLLDGLAAEREQNITIDVAYRFFTTARRKFIVMDAPGHEQYTRNMATGASTADLALLLVSAADGLTRQTMRQAMIVSTLGVRRLVVAVNKMDLVDWSESEFVALEGEIRAFARYFDVEDIACIPLSARDGDNVVFRSERMPWYPGSPLLEHLEEVECRPHHRELKPCRRCSARRDPDQDRSLLHSRADLGAHPVGKALTATHPHDADQLGTRSRAVPEFFRRGCS
jgi:sulfate adenylyltransferase subunit 1